MPEPARFFLSGNIGSAAFWLLNELCVAALPPGDASITQAWFLSYLVSIWLQHLLHSTLVYGWRDGYWSGLAATCEDRPATLSPGFHSVVVVAARCRRTVAVRLFCLLASIS